MTENMNDHVFKQPTRILTVSKWTVISKLFVNFLLQFVFYPVSVSETETVTLRDSTVTPELLHK